MFYVAARLAGVKRLGREFVWRLHREGQAASAFDLAVEQWNRLRGGQAQLRQDFLHVGVEAGFNFSPDRRAFTPGRSSTLNAESLKKSLVRLRQIEIRNLGVAAVRASSFRIARYFSACACSRAFLLSSMTFCCIAAGISS